MQLTQLALLCHMEQKIGSLQYQSFVKQPELSGRVLHSSKVFIVCRPKRELLFYQDFASSYFQKFISILSTTTSITGWHPLAIRTLAIRTVAMRQLPFGDSCHLDTCHSKTVAIQTVAIRRQLPFGHLPFGAVAIQLSCHSVNLPFGTVAIRRYLPFRHLPFRHKPKISFIKIVSEARKANFQTFESSGAILIILGWKIQIFEQIPYGYEASKEFELSCHQD